jgi:ubiquinone/menaquinone biosynthesis C-methylase UbiE
MRSQSDLVPAAIKTRGETQFARIPRLAAWAFDTFMGGENAAFYTEFARDIATQVCAGRLLDVCSGPGRLLDELAGMLPEVELLGLDLSLAMVRRAQRRLGSRAAVVCAPVAAIPYADASVDVVVCTASFYQWDAPVVGLNEIHRVLKPGGVALLYETYRDGDSAEIRAALKRKLAGSVSIRERLLPPVLLRHVRMTYTRAELVEVMERSRFAGSWRLDPRLIAELPGWVRVTLTRGLSQP